MKDLSIIDDEPIRRLQQAVGLLPKRGLGLVRRAIVLALLTWLPVALWAWMKKRAFPGALEEPLLAHYGVHVRCLVAIPLFIIAEGTVQAATRRLLNQFVRRGVVVDPAALEAVVESVHRVRRHPLPWAIIGLLTLLMLLAPTLHPLHELQWANTAVPTVSLGFGGWWYLYVSRGIYISLALVWLWRLGLLTILLRRIARMELSLVPTHPDRFGGLGFLTHLPVAFAPVILALSAVMSSGWAHQVVYHELALAALRVPAVFFILLMMILFMAPVLVFTPVLAAARRSGLEDYGALMARHGRLVRQRWVEGREVSDDLLQAPEIGPVADTIAMFDAVTRLQPFLMNRQSFAVVLLAAIIPMIVVISLKVPIAQVLGQLLKALV